MTAILIEAFWKSGAILGIALLANLALRKKSADLRRLILSSAIVALFIAALATALLPRWNTELPIGFPAARTPRTPRRHSQLMSQQTSRQHPPRIAKCQTQSRSSGSPVQRCCSQDFCSRSAVFAGSAKPQYTCAKSTASPSSRAKRSPRQSRGES